jgi:hypothetical protein
MTHLPLASHALALGGVLTFAAALAHLACIAIGAPAYRFMGAGEAMAQAAAAGRMAPTLVTLSISLVLLVWSAYALSGAGLLRGLPLAKPILVVICAVFLLRAFAFPLLKPAFPDNSTTFWLDSSAVCLLLGALYLYGILGRWKAL